MCRYREETVREIHSHLVRIDFIFYCVFFCGFTLPSGSNGSWKSAPFMGTCKLFVVSVFNEPVKAIRWHFVMME